MKRAASPLENIFVMQEEGNILDKRETSFSDLPLDCIKLIFCFSSCRELLSIEQASRQMRVFTPHRWKQLCEKEKISVDWSKLFGMKEENCPEKFTYRTERALQSFFAERMRIIRHAKSAHYVGCLVSCPVGGQACLTKETAEIQNRFKCIGIWNSYLSTYINKDLQKLIKLDLPHEGYPVLNSWNIQISQSSSNQGVKIHTFFRSFEASINHLKPGKLFLRGLSYLTDYALQIDRLCNEKDLDINDVENMTPIRFQLFCAFEFLKASMKGGVIDASLAIHEVIGCFSSDDIEEVFFQLALLSAERGDYRALEKLFSVVKYDVRECFIEGLVQAQMNYPPLLIYYALQLNKEQGDRTKVQELFREGIDRYQKSEHPIPGQVWLIGVKLNIQFGKWEDAKECLDCALADFGENIPFKAWKLKEEIQFHFGDLEGASLSLQKILDACQPSNEWAGNENWLLNGRQNNSVLYSMGKIRQSIAKDKVRFMKDRLTSIKDLQAHSG